MVEYRAPIVVVVGHVDVGKTLLLDKIRNTAVAYREPGMITQHIGLSYLPWPAIERYAASLLAKFKLSGKIWVRGFLMVDTPGHAAFSNLRRRGGSVADLAILVIDALEGVEEQTKESLFLLKSRGIPFVVAANKVDKIYGWEPHPNFAFIDSYEAQDEAVQGRVEEMIARIAGELAEHGIEADRYDRVADYSRQVPIVPTSAVTGEGVADLLVVLAGLTQRLVRDRLAVGNGPGRGVIMEIKEEKGWGTTADAIIYDGSVRRGDRIAALGLDGPFNTTVRLLVMPKPLDEMRDPEDKYVFVDEVKAAAGVRVVGDSLERAVPGSPLIVVRDEAQLRSAMSELSAEAAAIRIEVDRSGVVAKADTLGTLESMVMYLRGQNIPVRRADIGPVTRRDVIEASVVRRRDPLYAVVLAFNVKVTPEAEVEAQQHGVRVFQNNILYRLVDDFLNWHREQRNRSVEEELAKLVRPGKVRLMPGYVFRRSNPIIVGVKVLEGQLKPGYRLRRADDGRVIGTVMQIQNNGRPVQLARKGEEVAVSIQGNSMVGRHVREGDDLYVDLPEDHLIKLLTDFREHLEPGEVDLIHEYQEARKRWA
ncbi:translation initiation factor IF-2 [Thermocladium modestius]|uniref:Probable translation initiation factor IF-2 n=1 Tax=Thermocladium modestius TaxID=62609 RepID=A0A830H0G9_9CREN|nr:translation initiation factor IF-2 [Thermocladium modestius]GGP22165.1 translation initiation factor IF-2 [Thermocladium modestius]